MFYFLAFPRNDVLAVDTISNVRVGEIKAPAPGTLERDGRDLPVYSLSPRLEFEKDAQPQRRFCVCLSAADIGENRALTCDRVEQYALSGDASLHELPEFMRTLDSPVRSILKERDSVTFVCTAESFETFVTMAERYDA